MKIKCTKCGEVKQASSDRYKKLEEAGAIPTYECRACRKANKAEVAKDKSAKKEKKKVTKEPVKVEEEELEIVDFGEGTDE